MTLRRLFAPLLGLMLLACAPALAADNYTFISGGVPRTMRATDVSGTLVPMTIPTAPNGVAYSSSAGLPVAQQGSWTFGLSGAIPTGSNVIGAVTQSGSWNVGVTGSVAVTGTFWQATQPVSAAALPLPAGAATAAKQPALGTAGAASADVITVQGTASMTPIAVSASQPSSIATAQVSVGSTATLIVAARAGRKSVQITTLGTTLVWLGAAGVTTSNGTPLPGSTYASQTIDGGAAVYGITASGSQAVSFLEIY